MMERQLQATKRMSARLRRQQKPSLLFRDMKGEGPQQVETLVEGPKAVVEEVRPDEGCGTLVSDVQWLPDVPFLSGNLPLEVHHAKADCLLAKVHALAPRSVVRQHRPLGSLPELFKAFADEWSKRWVKVHHLEAGRWDRVLETFPDYPSVVVAFPPITVAMWGDVVKSKPTKARGPDGVNRQDLLNLPSHLFERMPALCARAERTGHWPRQMILGLVTSLAKTVDASEVHHCRP